MRGVLSLVVKEEEKKDTLIFDLINKRKNKDSLVEVEKKLKGWRVNYEVKNPNHIKIGSINYYISTGTCYIDGMEGKFKQKGLDFLKQILKTGRIIR